MMKRVTIISPNAVREGLVLDLNKTIGASILLGVVWESLAPTNLPCTRIHKGYS